jgi:phage host-nuclease inhibitor protein Gam
MKPEITNKPTKTINHLTAGLVFLLAAGSFILSYSNLYETGLSLGLSPKLAWIWPLLVDFALIVFSLAVVRAGLHNERTWWPWLLVGVYTVATVAFNIYHAPANLAAQIVAIVAPVSLFLSFETLMGMLKSGVRRSGLSLSIGELSAKLNELEGLYRERQDNLEAELKRVEGERLAEIEANRLTLANQIGQLKSELGQLEEEVTEEIGQLESQQARLEEEVTAKAKTLDSYAQDIEAKKQELKGLTGGLTKTYLPANLTLEQKQDLANQMASDGLTNEQIKDALGVSLATVKNYKKANRLIDPADVPITTGGQNGKH